MAATEGSRHDPLRGFKFTVVFNKGNVAGFEKVTGIELEVDETEYREGNQSTTPRKLPGMIKFSNIVLSRGVFANDEFERWVKEVLDVIKSGNAGKEGQPAQLFRRTVQINVHNRLGDIVKQFTVLNAWPKALRYSDLDAQSSDVWRNELELVHEGLTVETRSVSGG